MDDRAGPLESRWFLPFAVDIPAVVGVHRRGHGDPAFRLEPDGAIWRTSLTPEGAATLRLTARAVPAGAQTSVAASARARLAPGVTRAPGGAQARGCGACLLMRAQAWGPGAAWMLGSVPAMLGALDDPSAFAPEHPLLRRLVREHPGLRIGRTGLVFEALVPAVLEQKVVGREATRAWRWLLTRYGEPAPGPAPAGMRVMPEPRVWAAIPSWDWHRAGVEAVRGRTIAAAARVAGRLEAIVSLGAAQADRRLRSLPGVGVWTSAEIRQRACGDPDAVSVGDYHLPRIVGWAMSGEIADDAGMLELLAPFTGQRHRAAVLLTRAGLGPARRAPRNPVRDYRAF